MEWPTCTDGVSRPRLGLCLAGLALGTVLVTGCGSGDDGHHTETSGACANIIRFHDHTYFGASIKKTIQLDRKLGTAVLPACNDGNGHHSKDDNVAVRSIKGIGPNTAIATEEAGNHTIYLAKRGAKLPPNLR